MTGNLRSSKRGGKGKARANAPLENAPGTTHAFQALADEIMANILRFLKPTDIFAMRKTCRSVYRASQSKVVWADVLHRVCDELGMFKPTFPVQRMSVLELEHAATAPNRFLEYVKKTPAKNDSVVPYHTRVLQFRRPGETGATFSVDALHLIPGGRFLITTGSGCLDIWDLGYNGNHSGNVFPLASLANADGSSCLMLGDVSPRGQGDTLLLATVDNKLNDSIVVMSIRQIDLKIGSSAKLTLVAELVLDLTDTIGRHPLSIHLRGDNLVLWWKPYVLVWNWVKNTGCRWLARDNYLSGSMYVDEKAIIKFSEIDANMVILERPQNKPLSQPRASKLELVTVTPKFVIHCLEGDDSDQILFSGPSVWQQSAPLDRHLAVLLHGVDYGFHLHGLRPLSGCQDQYLPPTIPVLLGVNEDVYGTSVLDTFAGSTSTLFNINNSLVLCSKSEDDSLVMTVVHAPKAPSQAHFARESWRLTPDNSCLNTESASDFAICPLSGRLLYISENDDRPGVIMCDYVLAPQEPFYNTEVVERK